MLADVASDEVCWDSLVGKITREGIFTVRLEYYLRKWWSYWKAGRELTA